MDHARHFPPATHAALAYERPGAWMPPLPPGCIRLSAGYPFPASVPTTAFARAAAELVAAEGDLPFHYLGTPGIDRLADQVRARLAQRGIPVAEGELLITAGALQALDLAARTLLAPGDLVAVEAPTYMETLEILRNYTPNISGYPVDGHGLMVEALADDLAARRRAGQPLPKLLYTIASYQNPTGANLSLDRRQRLLLLAEEYGFVILEDDAYGELAFGTPLPTLRALDHAGRVIYAGSLSKVVAPGVRIGWAVAPAPVITAMGLFKKDLDHAFVQALTSTYLASIDLAERVAHLREQYRARRDLMQAALRQHLPPWVTWNEPQGGYFVWLHTPGVDTAELLPLALAAGVAYVPGKHFYFGPGQGTEYLRLSFSHLAPEQLELGVALLGQVLASRQ